MSEFKTCLEVRLLPENNGGPRWQLVAPLVYSSEVMGCDIPVPGGFITDFVSFALLKNVGHRASVIHDYLYSCSDVAREMADKVLCEALACTGVDEELRDAMYEAVRLFGGGHKESIYQFYKEGDDGSNNAAP